MAYALRMGNRLVAAKTLADASAAFRTWIEKKGYRSSDLGPRDGEVSGAVSGTAVARISYNGRIWDLEGYEVVAQATTSPIVAALQAFVDLADAGELTRSLPVDTAVQNARDLLAKPDGAS